MHKETIKYLKKNGRKGGLVTKKKMPPNHYKVIGKLGGRPKKTTK